MKNGVAKKQKRYTDRAQVLKDYAAAQRKRDRILKTVERLDSEADMMRDSEAEDAGEKIRSMREEADRLVAQAKRIEETRLPKLKQALDDLDTAPLSIPGYESRQVVLRPLEKR